MEEMALGCAYVNIGGGTTSITIYKERFPLALFVLPLGGNNITRDLTQLSIPLLDADAERMKVEHGSMNLSVSRTQEIVATSVDGTSTKRFSQLEVNRYINARILEILSNVVSIIHEADCSESIPKGFVFAGGVTKTDYFYETLRKLSPEYRKASLRRDIYEEGSRSDLLEHYITEIALAYQATEPSVTYTLRPLDSLLHEESSPAPVEPATPVSEPLAEEEAKTYTYTTIGEVQAPSVEEADEDGFEDDDFEDEELPHDERPKAKKSWSIDTLKKGLSSLFGTNDSGDDY